MNTWILIQFAAVIYGLIAFFAGVWCTVMYEIGDSSSRYAPLYQFLHRPVFKLRKNEGIKRDLSTPENRQFWDYVHKTAKEARKGDWQKGAVNRGDTN